MKQVEKQMVGQHSLFESRTIPMNTVCANEQREFSTNSSFEKFSLFEDSKYESHVSCNFDNVKL